MTNDQVISLLTKSKKILKCEKKAFAGAWGALSWLGILKQTFKTQYVMVQTTIKIQNLLCRYVGMKPSLTCMMKVDEMPILIISTTAHKYLLTIFVVMLPKTNIVLETLTPTLTRSAYSSQPPPPSTFTLLSLSFQPPVDKNNNWQR
jgi:hypothetical protein